MMRVEAARRIFPRCWFNEKTTEAGRDALGCYHERRDENRNVGLGPEHDWSSHAADAFGYLAIAYDEHRLANPQAIGVDLMIGRAGRFGRRSCEGRSAGAARRLSRAAEIARLRAE